MTRRPLALLVALSLLPLALPAAASDEACASGAPDSALTLVNALRAQGLRCTAQDGPLRGAPLAWSHLLERAARQQAQWLATQEALSHTGPQGQSLSMRAAAVGYRHARIAENLASGQESVDEALRAWETSAGHCRNLIDPAVSEMALACVRRDDGDPVWVMTLGRPR